jgi:hypothetical protein
VQAPTTKKPGDDGKSKGKQLETYVSITDPPQMVKLH